MNTPVFFDVVPQYGWGWRFGSESYTPPVPFAVEITEMTGDRDAPKRMAGLVAMPQQHEFIDYHIMLIRRTAVRGATHYSLLLRRDKPFDFDAISADSTTVTGYAVVNPNNGVAPSLN